MESKQQSLTNIQLELLQLYSHNIAEQDLLEIKKLLANYFAKKAMDGADKMWDEKNWKPEDGERMSKEHLRTPYKLTH